MDMVFVSYSRNDELWLNRFTRFFSPLKQYLEIDFWSDQRINPGEHWEDQINDAMRNATVAVLLVSDSFLDSDFIRTKELPYILNAADSHEVEVLWIRLTPCYYQATPLRSIQAAAGFPLSLNQMEEALWQQEFWKVCQRVDQIAKKAETPIINSKLNGKVVSRLEPDLQVLAKPAVRETEVLIYSGDGWWPQSRVAKGSMHSKCYIGDVEHTKPGDEFTIVALTLAEGVLRRGKLSKLPDYRTKSEEVVVKRC